MAGWSRLLVSASQKYIKPNELFAKVVPNNGNLRCMSGHKTMVITASRWQWHKTKDWFHFYFFVGAIPITVVIFCANVFVGPATLEPIPEGYVPKQWEYYRSPITRFISKYLASNPQEEYEKYLHFLVQHYEIKQLRDIQTLVQKAISNYQDYPAYSYRSSVKAIDIKKYRKYIEEQTA